MKYFIVLGTFLFCASLNAEPQETVFTSVYMVKAYRMGFDAGVNKKIEGCTLRSM